MLTKSLTSLAGFVIADVVAQLLSERQKLDKGDSADGIASSGLDVERIGRVGLFGFLFYGPVSGAWYGFLDDAVLPDAPTCAAAVTLKTAADQLLWAPVLVSCLFAWDLVWSGSESEEGADAKGGVLHGLQAKLERDLLATLLVNWAFWPVFHLINFRLVPPGDRVLYVNIVQVFYNVFLCWQAAKRTGSETPSGAVESKRT